MSVIIGGDTGIAPATWTTAARPTSPSLGQQGYNTTLNSVEYYNGVAWFAVNSTSTAVTLNKPTGRITMNNAALAANTSVIFALSNSLIAATDTVSLSHNAAGGTANAYITECLTCGAGSVTIRVTNITGGSLSESLMINFAIIKGVTS